ncbi:MAG: hypothetical protein H7263_08515, partial [Candidatus Sericytochromatia bacterium]|nr:hypothetical protein [Candidatus Sericytochromatia bacterium]
MNSNKQSFSKGEFVNFFEKCPNLFLFIISSKYPLSHEIINMFPDKWNWKTLSANQNL